MDLTTLTCPNCGKVGACSAAMIGRNVRCPRCSTWFVGPQPEPEPEPEPFAFPPVRERLFPLRERLNDPVLARLLRNLVPLGARATLMGGMLSLGNWVYSQPPYLLGGAAALWAWRQRKRLNIAGIFGSARFETLKALESARMVGREGLLLGRHQESDFRRSRALLRLFTRPWSESDGVCRHFLTAMTGQLFDFSKGAGGPLLCVPRGDYCHLATIAPTGAGKGVNTVITNLLNYPFSAIVVDPKGENYRETAAYRRKTLGHDIVVLDPCGITGATTATLNPLDLIDATSPTVIEDVKGLAEAMIVKTAQDHDPYWNEMAVTVLTGIMLLVVTQGVAEAGERSLNHVRTLLTNQQAFETALEVMIDSDDLGGMLARYGGQIASIPDKERNSVLSGVNRHSNVLDSELVARSVASTSFDIRAVARRPTTVYLVIPAQHLQSLSRLLRLWINSLLLVVKQAGASEEHEILFILDEFAQLGEMRPVEEAVTLLRGFGLRVWLILQSISQLESCYGKARARTLLGNCQTLQLFGVSEYETAEFISKHMGDTTVASPNQQEGTSSTTGTGPNSGSSGRNQGWSFGAAARKLLQPEEILRMPDSVFILHKGRHPILGSRLRYYADPEFEAATGEGTAAPRPVSRVSAVLCGLGVLGLGYVGVDWLSQFRAAQVPALVAAQAATYETPTFLPISSPAVAGTNYLAPEKATPKPPMRPRVAVVTVTTCPHCKRYEGPIPPGYAGQELECPKCGLTFTVNLP